MEQIINLVAVSALAVLGAVCLVLGLWCQYNDGLIGKCGLFAVAIAAAVAVTHHLEGRGHDYDAICAFVFVGMALVKVRHLWRRLPRLHGRVPRRRAVDRGGVQ